jgi:hypothetical protein
LNGGKLVKVLNIVSDQIEIESGELWEGGIIVEKIKAIAMLNGGTSNVGNGNENGNGNGNGDGGSGNSLKVVTLPVRTRPFQP